MKLTVAANYDCDVIPELAQYPVAEVYGKFPVDVVGGGRPSYMGTPISKSELQRYVTLLDRHGIAFNYLLNSSCHGNREWTGSWQKRFMRLMDRLGHMGIRHVTVSTPLLLEMIKKRFADFQVKVGIYAQVDTPHRARFWESLGADAINLESFSINRDFPRLAAIRDAVRCDLQLIANHCCLPNCAMQVYHQNGFAHSSNGSGVMFLDYCFLRCSHQRMADPSLLIKAGWIRPEDLDAYEQIGYTTFKLIERGMPSEELLKRVKAYSHRRFEGNLAELILPYGFKQPVKRSPLWMLQFFLKPFQFSPLRLVPLLKLARSQGMLFPADELPVVIDSAKIPPDFLKACQQGRCAVGDCQTCEYCERISRDAVHINEGIRDASLRQFAQIHEAVTTGKSWGM